MLKRIFGLVLALIGIVLGYALFTSTESETQAVKLKEAVYLSRPEVLPANEGKVVIFPVKEAVLSEPAVDTDMGIQFPSPAVGRYVEIYTSEGRDDKENIKMTWSPRGMVSTGSVPFTQKKFYGSVKVGDFVLKGRYLDIFQQKDFTGLQNDMGAKFRLKRQEDYGRVYLTQSLVRNGKNLTMYKGKKRIRYTYVDMDGMKNKTLAGIQKGNELVSAEDFRGEVYNGQMSKEDIQKRSASRSRFATVFGYTCCAGLVAAGIFLLL